MPTQEKIELVGELRQLVEDSTGLYLTRYQGLNVKAISELRREIGKAGGAMLVSKNRLLKIALQGTKAEGLTDYLTGPNAAIFCPSDPVGPAKAVQEFAKTHDSVSWQGGYIDGQIVDGAGMAAVASLPSRDELLASVVGAISAPVSGLVGTLNSLLSDVVYTLQAVADKKSAGE
jgi:large subunit ribosomal protein L10